MTIGWRQIIFSLNSFGAAMLALFISFSIGLERPFWAMTTVYIASQPLSGASRSKGAFRLAGTVIGAAATILIVPAFINAPLVLSLVMALWVGLCLYISLLDRTPRSYLFMLAGYTAALIGFPAVLHPEAVFDLAVLRAQEIGVGVICAMVFHSIFFPSSVTEALGAKLQTILNDAERWTCDALAGQPSPAVDRERRRLAMDTTELHVLASHIPYDTARLRPSTRMIAALQDQLILLLPLASAVEDRIVNLRQQAALPQEYESLIADVRAWIGADEWSGKGMLPAQCARLEAAADTSGWTGLLQANLARRLADIIELVSTIRSLARLVLDPTSSVPTGLQPLVDAAAPRALHLDRGMALLSAAAAMLAILGCSAVWIFTGWSDGASATMFAAVIACFFASLDDPTGAQRAFLRWSAAAIPLVALYLLAILPMTSGFAQMALVLAPLLLPIGILIASPATALNAMPLTIGVAGGLALSNNYGPAHFEVFANANFALLTGSVAAIVATRLVRIVDADTAVARLLRSGWRDLAAIQSGPRPPSMAEWTGRMLDRVGLILARLPGITGTAAPLAEADALRDLRTGMNVIQLQTAAADGHASDRLMLLPLVDAICGYFKALSAGERQEPSDELRQQLDRTIETLADRPARALGAGSSIDTMNALVALRRNLFPAASPWRRMENPA